MVVYPHAAILTKERAQVLEEYVRQGGLLIMGARTGYKDIDGHCPMMAMPGHAAPLCGVEVVDFTTLVKEDSVQMDLFGQKVDASLFSDILKVTGPKAQVLGRFASDYYQGEPALVENPVGQGKAVYFGSAFTRETAQALLAHYNLMEPYKEQMELPECCELAVREKDGKSYTFILNYSGETASVKLHESYQDLLSGEVLSGEVQLPGYGVYILEK